MRLHPLITLPALLLALALHTPPLHAADDFSPAEKALFMDNQFRALKPPLTLRFAYRKTGSLEPGFEDTVAITLRRSAEGICCAASTEFLHGERALMLPDIESTQGNPAILYFLERDIREMQRLTQGKQNYFRKRIRMAVFQGATVRPVQLEWAGKPVDGQEIVISPYLDDPLRGRFEQMAGKEYVFTLSAAVPGGVHSIRTRVAGGAGAAAGGAGAPTGASAAGGGAGSTPGAPPLWVEEMQLVGTAPAAALPKPAALATRKQP